MADQLKGIRERLRIYLAAGHSVTLVARAVRRSQNTVNRYLAGDVEGMNVSRLESQLQRFLKRQDVSPSNGRFEPAFVLSSAAEDVFGALHVLHVEGQMGLIWGASGLGKTRSIMAYAQSELDTVVITANATFSVGTMLQQLSRALDLDVSRRSGEAVIEITNALRDSHRLVVCDETEYVPIKGIELLRHVADQAQVGVALVGTPPLYALLSKGDSRHSFAQIWSRLAVVLQVQPASKDDIGMMIPEATGKVLTLLHKASGGIPRNATKTWQKARRLASTDGGAVTYELLSQVVEGGL